MCMFGFCGGSDKLEGASKMEQLIKNGLSISNYFIYLVFLSCIQENGTLLVFIFIFDQVIIFLSINCIILFY